MAYEVVDSQQRRTMTAQGKEQVYYSVTIETENGSRGTIDVPAKDWNEEKLTEILDQFAADLDLPYTLGTG